MRRDFIFHTTIRAFAVIGFMAAIAVEAMAGPPPVRTVRASLQVGPPPAPIPDPSLSPGSLSPVPSLSPGIGPTPGAPIPPVPPPDASGPMYSTPFGTMREPPPPPPKQYPGDPNGIGSSQIPSGTLSPVPLNSNQSLPPLDANATGPTTDRFGAAPPPGTLGQTYHRRSQVTDVKKHPRVGIVEVHLSENYDVSAKGLKSKWNGKVWQLESDPLLPGIPHIFEVKAEWGPEDAKQKEVRTVRLVMGRIVDLDF